MSTDSVLRIRRLIADQGAPPIFADGEIQDTLDTRKQVHKYLRLAVLPTLQPGGVVVYDEFVAAGGLGDWETDVTLVDGRYNPLTPSSSDLHAGRWKFATTQLQGVYLSGTCYDLYGAAADLLEEWAAKLNQEYDFSPNHGAYFKRSQQAEAKLKLAQMYRQKQRPVAVEMTRSDVGAAAHRTDLYGSIPAEHKI